MYKTISGSKQRSSSALGAAVCWVSLLLVPGQSLLADAVQPTGKPVRGHISSGFGYRKSPFTGKREHHNGVDIVAPRGAKVVATGDGTVIRAGWLDGSCGRGVKLQHSFDYITTYCHMSRVRVTVGDRVRQGAIIGNVGSTGRSTGPHLHYAISRKGRSLNPKSFMGRGLTNANRAGVDGKDAVRMVWKVRPNTGVKIPDPYATLLRKVGYFNYVNNNIDQIDFVEVRTLARSDGTLGVGFAGVVKNHRIAKVATLGRSPLEITSTIVHEAAHLEPWSRSKRYASQEQAYRKQSWFLQRSGNAQAKEMATLREDKKRLREDVKQAETRAKSHEAELAQLRKNERRLRADVKQRTARERSHKAELAQLRRKMPLLQGDIKRWKARAESQGAELAQLRKNEQRLRADVKQRTVRETASIRALRDPVDRIEGNLDRHGDTRQLHGAGPPDDAEGQIRLGVSYRYGENGFPKDHQRAARFFQLAAQQGHPEGQAYMGILYSWGEGVRKNDFEAARWFRLAARQGHNHAQFHLGLAYWDGEGVPQDYQEAIRWLRRAAHQGNLAAQRFLANI